MLYLLLTSYARVVCKPFIDINEDEMVFPYEFKRQHYLVTQGRDRQFDVVSTIRCVSN